MHFQIRGLDPAEFRHLYGRSNEELAGAGAKRYRVDAKPGFPDRVEVRDLERGETAILLNYTHQKADTPYRASHAIFVREGAEHAFHSIDEVPDALRVRSLSVRAFDADHMMIDADVVDGSAIESLIQRFFGDAAAQYLHVHTAKRGCYLAQIDRA